MDGRESFEQNIVIDFEYYLDDEQDDNIKANFSMKTISEANGLKINALQLY